MDRRAITCFDEALTTSDLGANSPLRQALRDYFAWATTTTMSRYHRSADDVPPGRASHTGRGTASRLEHGSPDSPVTGGCTLLVSPSTR